MSFKDSIIGDFIVEKEGDRIVGHSTVDRKPITLDQWRKYLEGLEKNGPAAVVGVDFSGVRVKGKPISDVELRKMPLTNGSLRDFDEYSKTIPSDRVRPEPVVRPITNYVKQYWADKQGKLS